MNSILPLSVQRGNDPLTWQKVAMDPETQAAWESWVTAHIRNQLAHQDVLEPMIQGIGEALAHERQSMRNHVKKQLATPLDEIDELRKELAKLGGDLLQARQKLAEINDQIRWLHIVSKAVRMLIRPIGKKHASARTR